jgi:hypothetical protein
VIDGRGHDSDRRSTETTTTPEAERPMNQITATFVNSTAAVIAARHRADSWCLGRSERFVSYMPNTKHQRLREPSSG